MTWMRSYRPHELFDESGQPQGRSRLATTVGHAADERQPPR